MIESLLRAENLVFLRGGALAVACGFVIGAERESRNKSAGVSTHILIVFGAMFFTMMSIAMEPENPGRIAANILTGIGFLGAGLIIKTDKGNVGGLTTAASVWFAAAIGMAIGFGWYFAAIIGTLVSTLTPLIPHLPWKSRRK